MREVRVEEDREAAVALRHGEIVERAFIRFLERLGLRRLFVLVLLGLRALTAPSAASLGKCEI